LTEHQSILPDVSANIDYAIDLEFGENRS
jgi:hypothetical protein